MPRQRGFFAVSIIARFQESIPVALPKISTVILSFASLVPLLSLVAPTTLLDVANNLYNNPDLSKLYMFSREYSLRMGGNSFLSKKKRDKVNET